MNYNSFRFHYYLYAITQYIHAIAFVWENTGAHWLPQTWESFNLLRILSTILSHSTLPILYLAWKSKFLTIHNRGNAMSKSLSNRGTSRLAFSLILDVDSMADRLESEHQEIEKRREAFSSALGSVSLSTIMRRHLWTATSVFTPAAEFIRTLCIISFESCSLPTNFLHNAKLAMQRLLKLRVVPSIPSIGKWMYFLVNPAHL